MSERKPIRSVTLGAAFLMATSAVGPGFLTQTSVFTQQLLASFGFAILISIIIDIFAQLNIWRVLTVSGERGQDVANSAIPGSGYLLGILVAIGGLVFNIGNIAGAGLGLNVIFGFPVEYGAIISAFVGIGVFLYKEAGKAMDLFVKVLGVVMLGLIVYVVFRSSPPIGEAAVRTFIPTVIDPIAIVTLVGGTVGGYITFAGAHRLIDAGITGGDNLPEVDRSAVTGIVLTGIIRFLLFLAAFGVVAMGFTLDPANPPASVFSNAAGSVGSGIFGVVMWSAAITSVIGSAYTSISFVKTFARPINDNARLLTICFIAVSTVIFITVGRPVQILIFAGTLNGFILPVGLALVLLATRKRSLLGDYDHPRWLIFAGWAVVGTMAAFAVYALLPTS